MSPKKLQPVPEEFPDLQATPYPELRKELQTGDVLICSGSGLFSAMIQSATGSDWSHVGVIIRFDEIDRVMLLESVEPIGVRTIRLSKYLTGYDHRRKKPYKGGACIIRHKRFSELVDAAKLHELMTFAIEYFGHPYDKDEIVKIASRIMASKIPFSAKQKRKIKADDEFICSEYVARCYSSIGIDVKWNRRGFIAPSDFAADENFELVSVMLEK